MSFLETILDDKRREVHDASKRMPFEHLVRYAKAEESPRPFKKALEQVPFALIAEIKKASPSKGTLIDRFDHRELARDFEAGGAHAISVLTDKNHFQGEKSYIKDVKKVTKLPVLRKDFIIDQYQVYESRALGADALLLIVKALPFEELRRLYDCAMTMGMAVLVETHSEDEIAAANAIGAEIIGINNRDLNSFEVSLNASLNLYRHIRASALAVSESGINSSKDVTALCEAGFQAALIGEGLLARADRSAAVREFIPR